MASGGRFINGVGLLEIKIIVGVRSTRLYLKSLKEKNFLKELGVTICLLILKNFTLADSLISDFVIPMNVLFNPSLKHVTIIKLLASYLLYWKYIKF